MPPLAGEGYEHRNIRVGECFRHLTRVSRAGIPEGLPRWSEYRAVACSPAGQERRGLLWQHEMS